MITSGSTIEALGLTLLHSLWQGAAVALLLGIALFFLRKQSAALRYAVAVGSLALILGSALATFFMSWAPRQQVQAQQSNNITIILPAASPANAPGWQVWLDDMVFYFREHAPIIVSAWMLGVLLLSLKLIGGYLMAQRLKTYRVRPADSIFVARMKQLQHKLGIARPVRLLESALASSPMTIGYWKPVVLMPIGMMAGLPVAQLEAILAHELAHIRRHDYVINLLQSLVEVVFFYHPATWWISNIIREEREHACDDMALLACGDSIAFAKALATVETGRFSMPKAVMAWMRQKSGLLFRIQRVLGREGERQHLPERLVVASLLTLAVFSMSFGENPKMTALKEQWVALATDDTVKKKKEIRKEVRVVHTSDTTKAGKKAIQTLVIINGDTVQSDINGMDFFFAAPAAPAPPAVWFSDSIQKRFFMFSPHADSAFSFKMDTIFSKMDMAFGAAPRVMFKRGSSDKQVVIVGDRTIVIDGEDIEMDVDAIDLPEDIDIEIEIDGMDKKARKSMKRARKDMEDHMEDMARKHDDQAKKHAAQAKKHEIIVQKHADLVMKVREAEAATEARIHAQYEADWKTLKAELMKDGLLAKEDAPLKFYLDKEELRVNGKDASTALRDKYLKMLAKYEGRMYAMSDNDTKIIIDMK
jgi:beta-lactamase regulating signal transducer with metallopeptidase domain